MQAATPFEQLQARIALLEDSARPEAVAARRASGGRTARENVAALADPETFVEYGRFALAAQMSRRTLAELLAKTPADGLIAGLAKVNGALFGDRAWCAVMAYDYTVLAGTQGAIGHRKKDRLFELISRLKLPVIFFTEGGGGRPGDTDFARVSALEVRAFALWSRLSGVVPRIAVAAGNCFAGNAVIAGAADLLIATANVSLGMGGPAMIAGGGLGEVAPEEIGPVGVQTANGVVDLAVKDERAGAQAARKLLSYFQGKLPAGEEAEQERLRTLIPERERRAYAAEPIIETICDRGTAVFLGERHAPELLTAFGRIEGRPLGVIANNTRRNAGALTTEACRKATRFIDLCDTFGLPVLSLIDTPGFMVGPEAEASGLVRQAGALLNRMARLRVPLIAVVLRRGYGLGAQAMAGGSLHEPLLTVAWPGAHLGPMGLEGAVRLGFRRELEQLPGREERERRVKELTAAAREHAAALNAAALFELDDVIDPAQTRGLVGKLLAAAAR